MPALAVVNSQQSQLVAAAEAAAGHTVAIQGLSLQPRLGQSQVIKLSLLTDTFTVQVDLTLFDAAFEEFGLYGEKKKKSENQ